MNDGLIQGSLTTEFLGSMSELVVTVSKVVIEFVAVNDFQDMKQKYINYHLREYNDYTEDEVVGQISLTDGVLLRDLCLISKEYHID